MFVRFIDHIWNGHFYGLLRPPRAFPDMGSFLNNDQFAVLHNILSVVGVFYEHPVCKLDLLVQNIIYIEIFV